MSRSSRTATSPMDETEPSLETQMEREVTCEFCQGLLEDPKLLDCLHVYCKNCILAMKLKATENKYKCPQCTDTLVIEDLDNLQSFTLAKVKVRRLKLLRQVSNDGSPACDLCLPGSRAKALYICGDCREDRQFLCHSCSMPHYLKPELKDHFLELVTNFQSPTSAIMNAPRPHRPSTIISSVCSNHGLLYRYFCETCSLGACSDCLKEHSMHNVTQTGDAVEDAQKLVSYELLDIIQVRDLLFNSVKPIEVAKQRVKHQEEFIEGEIKSRFLRIRRELEHCEKNLFNQLHSVSQSKQDMLQSQAHQVSQLIERANRLAKIMSQTAEMPDESSLMSLMNLLIKNAQNMKKDYSSALEHSTGTNPAKIATIKRQASLTPCEMPNMGLVLHPEMFRTAVRDQAHIYIKMAEPSNCTATGPGLVRPQALSMTYFSIQLRDSNNRLCIQWQDIKVQITIRMPNGSSSTEKPKILHKGQGKYTVIYCPRASGLGEIQVIVEDKNIKGSPYNVIILPPSHLAPDSKSFSSLKQLKQPTCVSIDCTSGHLIVYDLGKLSKIDKNGTVLWSINSPLIYINGIDIHKDNGCIFVTSAHNCIGKLSSDGQLLEETGNKGTMDGEFNSPQGILVTKTEVFVCDSLNHRVQVFDETLKFKRQLSMDLTSHRHSRLQLPGEPYDITVNENGFLFISDVWNSCIVVFTSQEKFRQVLWEVKGAFGQTELCRPHSVVADTDGYLYVSDTENHRIAVFNSQSGECIATLGQKGSNEEDLDTPTRLAVDREGHIFICDKQNKRIQVFHDTVVKTPAY